MIWYCDRINIIWLDIAYYECNISKIHLIIWSIICLDMNTITIIRVSKKVFLTMQICKDIKQRKFATMYIFEK